MGKGPPNSAAGPQLPRGRAAPAMSVVMCEDPTGCRPCQHTVILVKLIVAPNMLQGVHGDKENNLHLLFALQETVAKPFVFGEMKTTHLVCASFPTHYGQSC